jgi:hypothetical protein
MPKHGGIDQQGRCSVCPIRTPKKDLGESVITALSSSRSPRSCVREEQYRCASTGGTSCCAVRGLGSRNGVPPGPSQGAGRHVTARTGRRTGVIAACFAPSPTGDYALRLAGPPPHASWSARSRARAARGWSAGKDLDRRGRFPGAARRNHRTRWRRSEWPANGAGALATTTGSRAYDDALQKLARAAASCTSAAAVAARSATARCTRALSLPQTPESAARAPALRLRGA